MTPSPQTTTLGGSETISLQHDFLEPLGWLWSYPLACTGVLSSMIAFLLIILFQIVDKINHFRLGHS